MKGERGYKTRGGDEVVIYDFDASLSDGYCIIGCVLGEFDAIVVIWREDGTDPLTINCRRLNKSFELVDHDGGLSS